MNEGVESVRGRTAVGSRVIVVGGTTTGSIADGVVSAEELH